MRNFTVAAVVAVLLAVAANTHGEEESVFQRTFRQLHQGPPPMDVLPRANVQTLWIEQKLDHFSTNDDRTWQMRYMSNDELYESGGPLFIFVGGEWAISPGYITSGHFFDMAKEHKGYMFYTEHRFYGESHPTSNMTPENLEYLHVRQALADLAHFITTMKATIPGASNSKVILAGGSYSATMVTWFKKLYPELATGCWASSAPLFAKANFYEYKEVTGESIRMVGGEACYNRIEKATAEMESMFATKRGAEVKAMFKLCDTFHPENDLDVWTLFSEMSDVFAGVVQTHNDGSIQSACNKIMEADNDLDGLANYFAAMWRTTTCNDLAYKTMVAAFSDTTYTGNIMRQWIFQTCNEYGWYQTSTSANQPFGTKFPLALYTQLCTDVYGSKFTNEFILKQIDGTNELFGGWTPNVENVYMSHGHLDPWRAMGVTGEAGATIIPLAAHCKDFGSITSNDSEEMRASKERVAELVREWLSE